MTDYSIRRLMVAPAELREELNAVAATLDTHGGERTFTVGLSGTGELPATYYVCNVALRETTWESIEETLATEYAAVLVFDAQMVSLEQVLEQLQLERVVSEFD